MINSANGWRMLNARILVSFGMGYPLDRSSVYLVFSYCAPGIEATPSAHIQHLLAKRFW
jgi:hypothetical protein